MLQVHALPTLATAEQKQSACKTITILPFAVGLKDMCLRRISRLHIVLVRSDIDITDIFALQVAQVLVESVLQSGASNKVVEIVAGKQVEASSPDKWFANL